MRVVLTKLIFCSHFGRPKAIKLTQQLSLMSKQEPPLQLFTFQRQVLSCAFDPQLISNNRVNADARRRAHSILENIISVGSYPPGLGFRFIRQNVSQYIQRVDRIASPKVQNIFLCYGVAQALEVVLKTLICNKNDAVMIPRPSQPLATYSLLLRGGSPAYYELSHQQNWQITSKSLQEAYQQETRKGKAIKAIMVVNPGDPSGISLSIQSLTNVLCFAVKKRLVVIAEQVYSKGVFTQFNHYNSCLRVLSQLESQVREECEIVSIHSLSKALAYQASYIYFHNIAPQTMDQLTKVQSMGAFSSSLGQLIVQLMVNPLQQTSQQTKATIKAEQLQLISSKKAKAKIINEAFSQMQNITFSYEQGSKYVYASIEIAQQMKERVMSQVGEVDNFYCNEGYKSTGTALISGGYFGQPEASFRFRMSPLIMPEQHLQMSLLLLKRFNYQFHCKYCK